VTARRTWFVAPTSILRIASAAIALAGLVYALSPARAASSSRAQRTADASNARLSTLHLRDSTLRQVKVEIRVGPDKACDALGTLGVQVLQQGQEWAVQFDDPVICWRRYQAADASAGNWTAWSRVLLTGGETRVVTL
jgi:hypothetical protein